MSDSDDVLTLFKQKRDEIGTTALANVLGVKNGSTIRMICTGRYPNPAHVLKRFAEVFIDVVHCPYVDRELERADCFNRSSGPRPFGGKSKQDWWDACQTCPHKGVRHD
ncbi:MAG: hypothetical protein PHU14_00225 [Methylovulum sp.]|nr:hypothetical protein [Methylovulum sp.]